MNAEKISTSDIKGKTISSLPSCPTNQTSFGGLGYSSANMKRAFDEIPLLIIDRFNTLLDDISAEPADSISATMKTGIYNTHTLARFFADIKNGNVATYLKVNGTSLSNELLKIKEAIRDLGGEI